MNNLQIEVYLIRLEGPGILHDTPPYRDSIITSIIKTGTVDHFARYHMLWYISIPYLCSIVEGRQDLVEYLSGTDEKNPTFHSENFDPFLVQFFRLRGMRGIDEMLLQRVDDIRDARIAEIKPFFPYDTFIGIIRDYIVEDKNQL